MPDSGIQKETPMKAKKKTAVAKKQVKKKTQPVEIPKNENSEMRSEIDRVFSLQMQNRFHIADTTAKERIHKLKRILHWIEKHRSEIYSALKKDFRKPETETDISEILVALTEIRHAVSHLKKWMHPQRVDKTLSFITASGWVQYEPRGVVLIISPWNFPFNLTLGPMISAIAAGNCIILKPSEYTPATSALIRKMIIDIFPENEVAMFEGDKDVSGALLEKPFHHIFFTGSPEVGKLVMAAAAKNLSSVTLELGGKSPVIIDEDADMNDAVEKITWGKFMNNGQTCIAPDYALVHKKRHSEFLEKMQKTVQKFYGETESDRKASPHFARIISPRHHSRLQKMIEDSKKEGAKIEYGGVYDENDLYISPTLLSHVTLEMPIMKEEIFGPVLPVLAVDSMDHAVRIVQNMEKPLALYIFSRDRTNVHKVLRETSAGGTCINETLIHFLHPNLPFGGVNYSGSGNSHGFYGFRAFSHERAILRHIKHSPLKLLYPPYTEKVKKLASLVLRYF